MHEEDAHDERRDGAQLHISREVIARAEQQPHGQHGGDEAIGHHQESDLVRRKSERARRSSLRKPMARNHRRNEQHHAKNTGAGDGDFARVTAEHPDSHNQRDRDGGPDGEYAPRDCSPAH